MSLLRWASWLFMLSSVVAQAAGPTASVPIPVIMPSALPGFSKDSTFQSTFPYEKVYGITAPSPTAVPTVAVPVDPSGGASTVRVSRPRPSRTPDVTGAYGKSAGGAALGTGNPGYADSSAADVDIDPASVPKEISFGAGSASPSATPSPSAEPSP